MASDTDTRRSRLAAPQRAKALLNREASRRLGQLGHTNRMTDEAKREAWWWLRARSSALVRRRGVLAGHAVVWSRQGWAELVPIEVPVAGPGEVTVAVTDSVVSPGTERAQYLKLPNARVGAGFRPGYSAAGRVIAVGQGVDGLTPGDTVAVQGAGHASVTTVPAGVVHRVPPGVATGDAALVRLGVICGHGVRLGEIEAGSPVCVVGAGLIGLLAQRLATAGGAGRVTVVATSRNKEEAAYEGGAAAFMTSIDDRAAIGSLGAPVVIEATGDPDALAVAIAAAGRHGRVVLLGSPRGITAHVPVGDLQARGLELVGAHVETLTLERTLTGGEDGARQEATTFLQALESRSITVDDLVAETVDPREAPAFYRALASRRDLIGARFDWTLLAPSERAHRARLLRLPDLRGRGVDSERAPLPPSTNGHAGVLAHPDPFADAVGMLRVGLLGCGDIAVHNAAALAEAPNARLVACHDPLIALAEDLAGTHDAAVAPSVDALLAREDLDAVVLAVPHHLHAPLALQAIAAGRHVVVEKPPANTLASAVEMVEAADRAGVVLSFCFPQRYDAAVVRARALVDAGAIGPLGGATAKLLMDRSPSYWTGGFSGRSTSDWRERRDQAGGGVLIMNLSHYVDLVRHLTDTEVESVVAMTAAVDRPGEIEDSASLSVRFATGAVGAFFGCTSVRGTLSTELRVWGRDGHIVVEGDPRAYTLASVPGLRGSRWQAFAATGGPSMRAVYFSRLATALHRGEPPEVSARDGLAVQALIEAAYRSTETGCAERPGELLAECGT